MAANNSNEFHSISLTTEQPTDIVSLHPQAAPPYIQSSRFSMSSHMAPSSDVERNLPASWATQRWRWLEKRRRMDISRDWRDHVQGWRIVVCSWINILLLLLPVSWTLGHTTNSDTLIFAVSITGLIPLVRLHDLSTHELAARIGGSRTGLVGASMSNLVEVVVAISALIKCELRVVQSALIGSILSKLLLVLGFSFFAGGLRFSEQGFDPTATQIHSSLLSISVGAVLLPAAYHFTLGGTFKTLPEEQKHHILHMSHGVSIILIFIYIAYLVFQLWSHTHFYDNQHDKKSQPLAEHVKARKERKGSSYHGKQRAEFSTNFGSCSKLDLTYSPDYPYMSRIPSRQKYSISPFASSSELALSGPPLAPHQEEFFTSSPAYQMAERRPSGIPLDREITISSIVSDKTYLGEEEPKSKTDYLENKPPANEKPSPQAKPQISNALMCLLLVVVPIGVAVTADTLVESMDGISASISKEWIGFILLPAVSSIAECMTAVKVSVKDELTLSISVAIGSTVQNALFVIPLMVTLAWMLGKPLSLLMDPFQCLVLYIAVQTTSYVIADGKSNWLEGVILISLYLIIALSFWYYPGSNLPETLSTCSSL